MVSYSWFVDVTNWIANDKEPEGIRWIVDKEGSQLDKVSEIISVDGLRHFHFGSVVKNLDIAKRNKIAMITGEKDQPAFYKFVDFIAACHFKILILTNFYPSDNSNNIIIEEITKRGNDYAISYC